MRHSGTIDGCVIDDQIVIVKRQNDIHLDSIQRNMMAPFAIIKLTEHSDRHIHRTLRMMKNHSMRRSRFGFVVGMPCGAYDDSRNT